MKIQIMDLELNSNNDALGRYFNAEAKFANIMES